MLISPKIHKALVKSEIKWTFINTNKIRPKVSDFSSWLKIKLRGSLSTRDLNKVTFTQKNENQIASKEIWLPELFNGSSTTRKRNFNSTKTSLKSPNHEMMKLNCMKQSKEIIPISLKKTQSLKRIPSYVS